MVAGGGVVVTASFVVVTAAPSDDDDDDEDESAVNAGAPRQRSTQKPTKLRTMARRNPLARKMSRAVTTWTEAAAAEAAVAEVLVLLLS